MTKLKLFGLFFTLVLQAAYLFGEVPESSSKRKTTLELIYNRYVNTPSNTNEHIPVLRDLAKECSSATEIGIDCVISTWGILQGLAESPHNPCSYLGIDITPPPANILKLASEQAIKNGVDFRFWLVDDMTITIEPTDMLFIDSLHTYCHLTYELETFSPMVNKYICMHDTSDPWGTINDRAYRGDYSEYPAEYDRTKKGLWPAVEDFLSKHPEWVLLERRLNNHGFTTLMRVRS